MNLLPKASGTRPRVACEISSQGVVAARSDDATAPLAGVARVELAAGAVVPGLKPGNIADRVAVIAAVRRVLESVEARSNSRSGDITLVVPDAAVRVLLLEFDSLPGRVTEALPLVRFRLKKLLPFDADEAMVSYQTMSSSKNLVRVLAVAIPRDVLAEYETVVREAGFEPGAVLPSTLAALNVLEGEEPALLINANTLGITTAIVQQGILLLHRSVDLQVHTAVTAAPLAESAPAPLVTLAELHSLPLVDVEDTAGEWAAQEPLPEHGRNPYAPANAIPEPGTVAVVDGSLAELAAQMLAVDAAPVSLSSEIAQAVSVAAAYFEDTLSQSPVQVLSAGPLGADKLARILKMEGVGPESGLTVRELVDSAALLSEAVKVSVPRAWLSSVLGALRG